MKLFILLVFLLTKCFVTIQAARILVLSPMGTKSHAIGIMPLVEALADKGHQVTLVTPHSHKTKSPNIHKIELSDMVQYVEEEWFSFKNVDLITALRGFINEFRKPTTKGYPSFMANKDIQRIIRERDVDLIILDAIINDFTLPIIDHLGVPFIYHCPGSGPSWTLEAMNVDQEFASVPNLNFELVTPMNFQDRLFNLVATKILLLARKIFVLWYVDEMARKDFPDARPAEKIQQDAALCLVNLDRATSTPRSLPPTMIPVGAMHCRPAEPLPKVSKLSIKLIINIM